MPANDWLPNSFALQLEAKSVLTPANYLTNSSFALIIRIILINSQADSLAVGGSTSRLLSRMNGRADGRVGGSGRN